MKDPIREIDCLLAQQVLDYEMRIVKPEWYPLEVRCFYWRKSKLPLMAYSYDQNACNARMYANGENAADGSAESLPTWAGEDSQGHEWEVVRVMIERGYHLWLASQPGIYRVSYTATFFGDPHSVVADAERAEWPQGAIALAALKAVGQDVSQFREAVRPANYKAGHPTLIVSDAIDELHESPDQLKKKESILQRANVFVMADDEGHKYVLCEDHPMPPVHALEFLGSFDIPEKMREGDEDGWGEAGRVARAKAKELNTRVEYHSDFVESYLASCDV